MIAPYYHSARVTLYNADCIDVMRDMPDNSVDLTVIDPPYRLNIAQGNKGCFEKSYSKLTSKRLQSLSDSFDIKMIFTEMARICKKQIYIFCSNSQISEIMSTSKDLGYSPTVLVWHKYNSVPFSHGTWRQDAEFIIHCSKSNKPFNGSSELKSKVKSLPLCRECPEHPTTKPLSLISGYITISSNPNDLIFDGFMGSGTTGVAAMKLNRRFIGVELSEEYCEIAKARIHAAELIAEADLFKPKG